MYSVPSSWGNLRHRMDQLLRQQCFPERGNPALVEGAVGLFQISVDILYNPGPDQKTLQRKDSRPWIWFGCFWNPPAELCSAPGKFCSWRDSSYSWPFFLFQIGATAEFANLSGHILRLLQQQKNCFCLQAISQAFWGKHHILEASSNSFKNLSQVLPIFLLATFVSWKCFGY